MTATTAPLPEHVGSLPRPELPPLETTRQLIAYEMALPYLKHARTIAPAVAGFFGRATIKAARELHEVGANGHDTRDVIRALAKVGVNAAGTLAGAYATWMAAEQDQRLAIFPPAQGRPLVQLAGR